jgi:hypothetical protein
VAAQPEILPAPEPAVLATLRDLEARTREAHGRPIRITLPPAPAATR